MRSSLSRPCVVCDHVGRDTILDVESWSVARCPGCGMHSLWPEPDELALDDFNDGTGYDEAFALREPILAQHHRSLAALEHSVPPGRLLDVGCGPGFLLEAARDRGWQAEGVDPSPFSVERARERGFTAHLGLLEDLDLPEASFDAIALLQVVEHMVDPRPLLAGVRRLLRPGGALLVATPNPSSLLARVKRERFNYWIPPVHVAWYSPRALEQLMRRCGFAPVRQTTWSARVPGLHDGLAVVDDLPFVCRLPMRVRSRLANAVSRVADATGLGSITEQIALRWDADDE